MHNQSYTTQSNTRHPHKQTITTHNHLPSHHQTMINGVTHPGQNPPPLHCKQTSPTAIVVRPNIDSASNCRTKKVTKCSNNAHQSIVYQQLLPLRQLQVVTQLEEWMKLLCVGSSKSDMEKWQTGAMWHKTQCPKKNWREKISSESCSSSPLCQQVYEEMLLRYRNTKVVLVPALQGRL